MQEVTKQIPVLGAQEILQGYIVLGWGLHTVEIANNDVTFTKFKALDYRCCNSRSCHNKSWK